MANTFTLCNVTYIAKPFDFNFVCDLEDMGISLEMAGEKPLGLVRAYISTCANVSKAEAGLLMQSHIIGGGNLDEVMAVIQKEMENSDFFQALNKTAEAESPKAQAKKTTRRK